MSGHRFHTTKERGGRLTASRHIRSSFPAGCSCSLLAEMPQPIFTHESGAGLANESTAVAIGAVIAVVSVGVGAERRRCDRSCRSNRTADHASSDITRPEPAVPMSLRPLLLIL